MFRCGVDNCNTRENEEILFNVCHHCGRPLCQNHALLIMDQDFSGSEDEYQDQGVEAYHCKDCLRQQHPRAKVLYQS